MVTSMIRHANTHNLRGVTFDETRAKVGGVAKISSQGAKVVAMVGCRENGGMNNEVVTGEDSFEDMFMTLVRAIFLGGFLVDEEALEALVILRMIMD
ncbi:hypothetical protein Tco_0585628 [Tanacetum coccineum]